MAAADKQETPAPRKNIMLGTAGHVDHGKTALVKLLTGCDTDRLAAEKQRGLTIELGFAPCRMSDERIVGIVDVPGHVDFIRNMVAGAHGVDVVILVVACDDGVMPQTREHLDILTLMGARHGLIALTKIDMVDPEMRQLAADDVLQAVAGTFLSGAPICPISNVTGEGFEQLFEALNEAVAACRPREVAGLFRLWIERAFTIRGFGTVVSGIPSSGEVRAGDRLELIPDGRIGRVRGLEVYGQEAPIGRAGECVAINLDDIDSAALARGKVLCPSRAFRPVRMVEAELGLLARAPRPLKDNAEVHLHVGTAEVMAHVALLEGLPLEPGGSAMVQLRLSEALGIAPGDRFVVRAGMAGLSGGRVTTLGGGRILGTSDKRLRRSRPWTLESLAARREAIDRPTKWCGLILKEAGGPLSRSDLAGRAHVKAETAEAALAELLAEGQAVEVGGAVVHRDVLTELAGRIVRELEVFHAESPMRVGAEETDLHARLDAQRDLFAAALSGLIDEGTVQRRGTVVALAGRRAQVYPETQELYGQVESVLRQAGLTPPIPTELAESLGEDPERVENILRLLADQAAVVRLDRKVVMHRHAVEGAKKVALELLASKGGFTTMEFRDALGVSRKFAVPLLDYFDTIRWTVRSGSRRTPGAAAKDAMNDQA